MANEFVSVAYGNAEIVVARRDAKHREDNRK